MCGNRARAASGLAGILSGCPSQPTSAVIQYSKYILFAAFVVPPFLPLAPSMIFAMLTAAFAVLQVRSRRPREVMQFCWPLLPLAGAMAYGLVVAPLEDSVRDMALILKPVLVLMSALLLGHVVSKREGAKSVERVAILGALTTAVIYLLFGIHGRMGTSALIPVAFLENKGGFYVWLPVMLLVAFRLVTGRPIAWLHVIAGVALGVCTLLSQSRSLVLTLVIAGAVAILRARGTRLARLASIAVVVGVLAVVTIQARIAATPGVGEVNELEYSLADYGEEAMRWRGFEIFRAKRMWEDGSQLQQVFGQGFGTGIDLGGTFFMAGDFRDVLPYTHNGYAAMLVKAGILGVACNLLFYLAIIVIAWRTVPLADPNRRPAVLAALGTAAILPVVTYTIMGVFSPGPWDPNLTFIAAIIGANTSAIWRKWRPLPAATYYVAPAAASRV